MLITSEGEKSIGKKKDVSSFAGLHQGELGTMKYIKQLFSPMQALN